MYSTDRPQRVVGVDTGGTFTDFVFMDDSGIVRIDKRPSNPADPARPVLEGLPRSLGEYDCRVVHGTTVATNALLEDKVAVVALITTAGFEDVIEIGRQNRPSLYALHPVKQPPLVPRHLRFGVQERMLHDGTIRTPLDRDEVRSILNRIRELGVQSVAVCLLHSYVNRQHEETIGEMARDLGFTTSLSCRVLPEFREYERTATVVVNAVLRPVMEGYLKGLETGIRGATLSVMQSAGGIIPARLAARLPVHTVLSGPAGGVIAAARSAQLAGIDRVITFDMGGTSTDVSLYDRGPTLTSDKTVAGHPIKVPAIDIHTVGAGGGSVAFVDAGGSLKVGPVSAGADPGPVCYGRGNLVTVTDANLFLGRMDPSLFLGGQMKIYPELIKEPMERLAKAVGLDPLEAAEGIVTVVNAVMERAVRVISIERGHDPRDFTLMSFGGAGGLHAVALARALGIPKVVIPKDAGVFSARGMALADLIRDLSRTVLLPADQEAASRLDSVFEEIVAAGIKDLEGEGVDAERVQVEQSLDIRYVGQSYEIRVPWCEDPLSAFHESYEKIYGYSRRESEVEIVTVRARLIVVTKRPGPTPARLVQTGRPPRDTCGRDLFYRGRWICARLYQRDRLSPGEELEGPALVGESSSTIFLPPGSVGLLDVFGNIAIEPGRFSS